MTEEERAALHRKQSAARAAYQQQMQARLAGSPIAISRLRAAWAPVTAWLLERKTGV